MAKNLENITYLFVIIAVLWYIIRSTNYGEAFSNEMFVKPLFKRIGAYK